MKRITKMTYDLIEEKDRFTVIIYPNNVSHLKHEMSFDIKLKALEFIEYMEECHKDHLIEKLKRI